MDSSLFLRASLASVGALIVPWEVLVSALVVSAAAEVVLLLVAAAEVLAGAEAVAEADALADAEGLEVNPPELPPQAARPKVAARLLLRGFSTRLDNAKRPARITFGCARGERI